MAEQWNVQVTVDAIGGDRCRVRPRSVHRDGSSPHLLVRAGPLMIYALDARAVTDLASAWAAAHVRGAHLLPVHLEVPRSTRSARGAAYPIAEVVVEGRQPWNVRPPQGNQPVLQVTAGWLTVRIHDRVALDTQVRAWTEASAFGGRVFGNRTTPFDALLEQQQIRATREAARDDSRLTGRTRPGREP
jgi:hypothetical protein